MTSDNILVERKIRSLPVSPEKKKLLLDVYRTVFYFGLSMKDDRNKVREVRGLIEKEATNEDH